MGRPVTQRTSKMCEHCQTSFEVTGGRRQQARRFCSKDCSNKATAAQRGAARSVGLYSPPICPCGAEVKPPPGQQYVYTSQKKYCSSECRATYGKKRQPDPANYITFTCQTCGKEVTRYRKYGNGANRFCSNVCAAKHTKVVRHYVVRDMDMVIDSSWEALFAGLCGFLKVPCERVDRSLAVEWKPGHHYAPDFLVDDIFVEIKGVEDDDDPEKWAAWPHPVVVVDHRRLNRLRKVANRDDFLGLWLRVWEPVVVVGTPTKG